MEALDKRRSVFINSLTREDGSPHRHRLAVWLQIATNQQLQPILEIIQQQCVTTISDSQITQYHQRATDINRIFPQDIIRHTLRFLSFPKVGAGKIALPIQDGLSGPMKVCRQWYGWTKYMRYYPLVHGSSQWDFSLLSFHPDRNLALVESFSLFCENVTKNGLNGRRFVFKLNLCVSEEANEYRSFIALLSRCVSTHLSSIAIELARLGRYSPATSRESVTASTPLAGFSVGFGDSDVDMIDVTDESSLSLFASPRLRRPLRNSSYLSALTSLNFPHLKRIEFTNQVDTTDAEEFFKDPPIGLKHVKIEFQRYHDNITRRPVEENKCKFISISHCLPPNLTEFWFTVRLNHSNFVSEPDQGPSLINDGDTLSVFNQTVIARLTGIKIYRFFFPRNSYHLFPFGADKIRLMARYSKQLEYCDVLVDTMESLAMRRAIRKMMKQCQKLKNLRVYVLDSDAESTEFRTRHRTWMKFLNTRRSEKETFLLNTLECAPVGDVRDCLFEVHESCCYVVYQFGCTNR